MASLATRIHDRLARYPSIAVWGAGGAGRQALEYWLPRARVVAVIDSSPKRIGGVLMDIPVRAAQYVFDSPVACIVICADACLEIREQIAQSGYRGDVFYVFELLGEAAATGSQWACLRLDLAVQKSTDWLHFLLEKPQFLVNVTYRLTKSLEHSPWLRPLYYLAHFVHTLTCVFFSIELPPAVTASGGLHFEHYGAIVIHKDAQLGAFCHIYQRVTVGSNDSGEIPVIGDFVTLYSGCSVLGATRLGDYARVGAHALVIDLETDGYCTIHGQPAAVQRRLYRPQPTTVAN